MPLNENADLRSHDLQRVNLGERVQKIFRQTIAEIFVVLVRTHVDEWEHSDRLYLLGQHSTTMPQPSVAFYLLNLPSFSS